MRGVQFAVDWRGPRARESTGRLGAGPSRKAAAFNPGCASAARVGNRPVPQQTPEVIDAVSGFGGGACEIKLLFALIPPADAHIRQHLVDQGRRVRGAPD